jgi:Peptidase M15
MTPLSPDFDQSEFEKDAPLPEECVASYTSLCTLILQPIREYFAVSMNITSGYRPPDVNQEEHGVKNSEHVATADYCAADWEMPSIGKDLRAVFDWIRNQSSKSLPFHQVILEHGTPGDIIHISWNKDAAGRQALEGATFNKSPYKAWSVA